MVVGDRRFVVTGGPNPIFLFMVASDRILWSQVTAMPGAVSRLAGWAAVGKSFKRPQMNNSGGKGQVNAHMYVHKIRSDHAVRTDH